MNNISVAIFFYAAIAVVILLSLCIIYLVFVYRKLLEKYSVLTLDIDRSEIHKKIKIETSKFVNEKVDDAIEKATASAVTAIAKNADSVSESMRKKTLEKLLQEEIGQEKAVASEYDKANLEIQAYKAREFEEIKKKSGEILSKVAKEVLVKSISPEEQENLIIKALENAKRSNLL